MLLPGLLRELISVGRRAVRIVVQRVLRSPSESEGQVPADVSGTPAAHIGQSPGDHMRLGSVASRSSGTPSNSANVAAASPKVRNAPRTMIRAPQARRSARVARVADPA